MRSHEERRCSNLGPAQSRVSPSVRFEVKSISYEIAQVLVVCGVTREFKLPWREAGAPNHHDNGVDPDH